MPGMEVAEPVTISVVARHAGVSTATVSRVLQGTAATSPDARSRVLKAVRALGYQPRRRDLSRPALHRCYAVLVPDLTPYHTEVLLGLLAAGAEAGVSVLPLLTDGRSDPVPSAQELADRVDGVVIAGGTIADSTVQRLAARVPVVLVGREPLPRCRSVLLHSQQAAQQLTEHLLEHGRERLVFVGDPDTTPDVASRYRGFRLAHAAMGVPVRRPALRVPLVEGAGRRVAEELQRRRVPVDGLVCASDEIALGVLTGLHETDMLVPDDLALVGWGDTDAARMVVPGLTTVRLPQREAGELAARMLEELRTTGREDLESSVHLNAEVVIRSSCGCSGPRARHRMAPRESLRRPRLRREV